MAESCVMVGVGPSAERLARAYVSRGHVVTLVRPDGLCGRADNEEVVVGTGLDTAPDHAEADAVLGAFVPFDAGLPAVAFAGKLHAQPMSRRAMLGAISPEVWDDVAVAWTRARAEAGLTRLVGGGREIRTYADWVARRVGVPMMERVFMPYARKRLGEPSAVSANEARRIHGDASPLRARAPAPSSPDGIVRVHAVVREVAEGRVTTEEGVFEGRVFLDVPPSRAVGWLPVAIREAIAAEARALEC